MSGWLLPLPLIGFLLFGSTGRDDAYITYWVADQLRRTGRLTNYDGKRLEQSSSLLHVLLLGSVSWISHLSVTSIGPWFAVAAGALCAPVAYFACDQLDSPCPGVAAALVATLPPLVYWSFGGLETSLATLLVLLTLLTITTMIKRAPHAPRRVAATLVALLLVRPEMGVVLVVALSIAAILVRFAVPTSWTTSDGSGRDDAARKLALTVAGTAGIALLIGLARYTYFGAWVPRPVAVKTGTLHIWLGVQYTVATLLQSGVVIAFAFTALVVAMRRQSLTPGWIVAGSLATTGIAAVIVPGGDWMECGRLLAPWLAVVMVLAGAVVGRVKPPWRVLLVAVLLVANTAGLFNYVSRYSTGTPAWASLVWHDEGSHFSSGASCTTPSGGWFERRNKVHARDLRFLCHADLALAGLAKIVTTRRLVVASKQAGMLVYYLERSATRRGHPFRFVDWLGITDGTWDRCRHGVASTTQGKSVPTTPMLLGRCGTLPDVLMGIGTVNRGSFGHIFLPVDVQLGTVSSSSRLKGNQSIGHDWFFVRRDLLPRNERGIKHRSSLPRPGRTGNAK